jgi:VanZ family protein
VTTRIVERSRSWLAAWAVIFLVSLVVLFLPGDDVPSGFPPGTDKVVHSGLFLALTVTARLAGAPLRRVIPLAIAYAVGSEFIQRIPALHRDFSWFDALADTIGALVGCGLAHWWARRSDGR